MTGGCAAVPPPCPLPEAAQSVSSPIPETKPEDMVSMPLTAAPVPPNNPALERKVRLQEKRIAELSSQLRLLKRIDLDRTKP
jgi:hypothetical protein